MSRAGAPPLANPLPANLDAERYLLGACIESPQILTAVMAAGMTEEHFSVSDHAKVCRALREMRPKDYPIDVISLAEYLGMDKAGPMLADLICGAVLHLPHQLHYLRILEEKRRLRALLRLADHVDAQAREAGADSKTISALIAQSVVPNIAQTGGLQ